MRDEKGRNITHYKYCIEEFSDKRTFSYVGSAPLLKGHSHENVCEIIAINGSLDPKT
jgi:hypothetical protein